MFEVPLYKISNLVTSFDKRRGKVLMTTFDGKNVSFGGDEESVDSVIGAIGQTVLPPCL